MDEDSMPKGEAGKSKKAMAIAVTLLVIGAALGAIVYWQAGPSPSSKGNSSSSSGSSNPVAGGDTYTGTIMPSEYLQATRGAGSGSGYYFVGYKDDNPDKIVTFRVDTNMNFDDITGGEFEISSGNGEYALKNVISNNTQNTNVMNLNSTLSNLFTNIDVSFTSLSVVYGAYTFGVGTTGSEDYIWIAPKKSYPTFFTDVEIKGVTFDEKALETLKSNFTSSVFEKIDLNEVKNITKKFSFDFSGIEKKFIIVTDISYLSSHSVRGDIIDTITPKDIENLANSFENNGTEWLQSVVSKAGEGIAIVSETNNTIRENTLWFLLYPIDKYESFQGICNLEVYESDTSNLTKRIPNLDLSSFNLHLNFSFKLKVGIIGDVQQAQYSQSDVKSLWTSLEATHSDTMVESVDVKGFAIVVDLKTLLQSLGDAFNLDKSEIDAITKLTTFKNPAFALMLDENLPNILKDNGTEAWKYASIAIIPNYETQNSALRYLDIKGTLYDPAEYFGINSSLAHIPIIVTDEYSEVRDNMQNVTVKDLKEGNVELNEHGWAYVNLDAITAGTTLKKLADEVGNTGIGKAVKTAVKAFPLDLGAYDGLQADNLSAIYQVPIIYVAAGHGPTYYHLNITHIRGMYVDVNADISSINDIIADKLTLGNSSDSTISEILGGVVDDILNFTSVPSGYILAFSISEINDTPPDLDILSPIDNSTIYESDFNLSFSARDNPDMALWAEVNITRYYTNIWGNPANETKTHIIYGGWDLAIGNGIWSSDEHWAQWKFIKDDVSSGDYVVMTIRIHDFHGYSDPVSVAFYIR